MVGQVGSGASEEAQASYENWKQIYEEDREMSESDPKWHRGDQIRKMRMDKGIGIRTMADRLGINKNTLSRIERGIKPCRDNLFKDVKNIIQQEQING